jgi:hypothetical protein
LFVRLSLFDPTRSFLLRRWGEIAASGGLGGVLALLAAPDPVAMAAWVTVWVLLGGGILMMGVDVWHQRQLEKGAWTTEQWDHFRALEYRRRDGLFLTHTMARTDPPPGTTHLDKQWWTVTARLVQHSIGPLSRGEVAEVEYAFAPNFTEGPTKVRGAAATAGFPNTTDLYGSLLILGRVHFKNRVRRPLMVETYVHLPEQ